MSQPAIVVESLSKRFGKRYARAVASDGRWLLESEVLPVVWDVYDLTDPGHPAGHGYVGGGRGVAADSGPYFLKDWRWGVLEFRAGNGGLEGLRYLADGREGGSPMVATADGYVYALKQLAERRWVSAYRVGR